MTNDQFNALAKLIRSQGREVEQAARLVLVDGLSNKVAIEQTGVRAAHLSNTLGRYRRAFDLAKLAVKKGYS